MTPIEIVMGIFAGAYLVLLNWLRLSIRSLKEALDDEKKQTVWRVDEIYKRIDNHKSELHAVIKEESEGVHRCRKEIDAKIDPLMTEAQVKDFVDRSLIPINKNLDVISGKLDKLLERNGE